MNAYDVYVQYHVKTTSIPKALLIVSHHNKYTLILCFKFIITTVRFTTTLKTFI